MPCSQTMTLTTIFTCGASCLRGVLIGMKRVGIGGLASGGLASDGLVGGGWGHHGAMIQTE